MKVKHAQEQYTWMLPCKSKVLEVLLSDELVFLLDCLKQINHCSCRMTSVEFVKLLLEHEFILKRAKIEKFKALHLNFSSNYLERNEKTF